MEQLKVFLLGLRDADGFERYHAVGTFHDSTSEVGDFDALGDMASVAYAPNTQSPHYVKEPYVDEIYTNVFAKEWYKKYGISVDFLLECDYSEYLKIKKVIERIEKEKQPAEKQEEHELSKIMTNMKLPNLLKKESKSHAR